MVHPEQGRSFARPGVPFDLEEGCGSWVHLDLEQGAMDERSRGGSVVHVHPQWHIICARAYPL